MTKSSWKHRFPWRSMVLFLLVGGLAAADEGCGDDRPHPGKPTATFEAPNSIWSADFKGHFKTRDGIYCYPLTVHDGFSRYLLACQRPIGDHLRRLPEGLHPSLPRVRVTPTDPLRQRYALRVHGLGSSLAPVRLVHQARHSARPHRARLPSPKRPSRTHAQRPQGRGHDTSGRQPVCSAAPLQCLPS